MGGLNPGEIAINFVVFLFSLSVHEASHALAAEYSGDPTGRYQGRITLNPIAHIDPIGTLLLPLMGLIYASGFFFGWAKPVPFNPMNLRNRKVGEIVIAAAGPASNLLLLILSVIGLKILIGSPQMFGDLSDGVGYVLRTAIQWNLGLAIFNMLPVPPLDGSHILRNLLPDSLADIYSQMNPLVGFVVLIVLVNIGVTTWLSRPLWNLILGFLNS